MAKFASGKMRPTQRALDAGDSAAFLGFFHALAESCSQTESTPAPAPVTLAVRWLLKKDQWLVIADFLEVLSEGFEKL